MKTNTVFTNAVCFLLLTLLPAFVSVALSQNSRTPGLMVAAAMIFPVLFQYIKFVRVPIGWINILMITLMWILLIPIVNGGNYLPKSYLSIFIAIFLLLFAFLIEVWFEKLDSRKLYRLVRFFWIIFFLIGWSRFFFKVHMFKYNGFSASVFPFSEPSYFAMVAGPIYVISFFLAPKKFKFIILINSILQAALFPSLSLFCYAAILSFIILQIRISVFIPVIIFAAMIFTGVLMLNPSYLKYCTGRLTLSSESGNLTSLAALQGIYAAKDSLIDTKGLGLGFQMLGTEKPNKITEIIAVIMHGLELGRPEGGFIAAKLIAELGVVGIVLAGLAFVQMLRSFFWLRKYWRYALQNKVHLSGYQSKLIIAHSFIVVFFVEMFMRGSGYFSLGAVFFIFSLLYVKKQNKCERNSIVYKDNLIIMCGEEHERYW